MKKLNVLFAFIFILSYSVFIAEPSGFIQNVSGNKMLSANGFLENKGQISDQNGNVNPDVRYIYTNKEFKCILKSNSFSYELFHLKKKVTETSMVNKTALPDEFRYKTDYTFHSHRVDINLINSNPSPQIETDGQSEDHFNYYY